MNHLLYNISIILIIIGIILLTNSLSTNGPTYYNENNNKIINQYKTDITRDYPSKVFHKMFDSPSVWMGYTDTESNEVIISDD